MNNTVRIEPVPKLKCPRCGHNWHESVCGLLIQDNHYCDCKGFAQLLQEHLDKQKQEKLDAKVKPYKDFITAAEAVGFTYQQAEFMWQFLSLKNHKHWDGTIG